MPAGKVENDGMVAYDVTQNTCGAVVRVTGGLADSEVGEDPVLVVSDMVRPLENGLCKKRV